MGVYENKVLKKDADGSANYVTSFVLGSSFEDITTDASARYYIDCAGWDEMTIYLNVNAATAADEISTRVDFSPDQTTWYPEADEVVTAGVATQLTKTRNFVTLTTNDESLPVISVPLNDRWARIMIKDDAGTTGTVRCQIVLSKVSS